MALTTRARIATGLVGLAVAAYLGHLAFDGVPLAEDVRGMAAVALVRYRARVTESQQEPSRMRP